jgi:protein TonB
VTTVVPLASARVADVFPVELVVVEPPPPVPEAPPARPAPPKRLTPPKPIATPLPKIEERREEPPPPAPVTPPPPIAAEPPPVPAAPAATPRAAAAAAPPAPSLAVATPPVSAPAGPPARSAPKAGLSWIDSSAGTAAAPATSAAPPAVASIPRDTGVTRVARPTGGYQVRPSYPSTARRLGIQGTTLLRVHVLEDGRVGEVDVEQSAGHPDLDRAAADAVRRWRFEPARRGDDTVAMWVRLPVEFRLR